MTTQSLRERRAERERKNRELMARILASRTSRIAASIANPLQQTIQPSVSPAIPSAARQQFEAAQSAKRTAFTPLGGVQVGTDTAAVDTRRKPEFGSWWGSGVAEGAAGMALPALENVQKGLETFGGAAVSIADLAPGSLFASQNQGRGFNEILQEVSEESGRGSFFDAAGQAQNLAEAFRRTNMPTTQVSLPWEGGIPLPGGRKIEDIDVGVKGAIELLPEVILGVATGGGSAAGSLARRTGVSVANALGADIGKFAVKGGAKAARKAFTVAPEVAQRARDAVSGVPSLDYHQIGRAVSDAADPILRAKIDRWPTLFKGPMTMFWNAASPVTIADTSRAAVKAIYTYVKGADILEKKREIAMAALVQKITLKGIPKKVKDVAGGVVAKIPGVPYSYTAKGIVQGSGFEKIDGIPWTELHENFFIPVKKGAEGRVEARHIWGVGDIGVWDATAGPTSAGAYVPRGVDVMPVLRDVRAVSGFNPDAADLATFIRHYQDSVKGAELNYLKAGGTFKFGKIKITDPETGEEVVEQLTGPILDYETSIYNPRNARTGTSVYDDADEINDAVSAAPRDPRTPGKQPGALKERSLTNLNVREQIDLGTYELMGPMETLGEHHRSMYKATLDLETNKFMKAAAKMKGSGLFDIVGAKARVAGAVNRAKKGTRISEKTLRKIAGSDPDRGFPQVAHALRAAMNIEDEAKRVAAVEDITSVFDKELIELNKQYFVPSKQEGAIRPVNLRKENRIPAYAGILFESKDEADKIAALHGLKTVGRFQSVSKFFAEVGDLLRLGRTGFDFGFHLLQGFPALGLAVATSVSPGMAVKATDTSAGLTNRAMGRQMMKAWGQSVTATYQSFKDKDFMLGFMAENIDIIDEAVSFNLQIGRTASDIYAATGGGGTILRDAGRVGKRLDTVVGKIAAPFERGFISPADVIRIQFYKAMRPVAALQGEQGLRQLAGTLNNMTGALSSAALGVSPNLQRIERGLLFFSPRYTRASLALVADVFKGNVSGQIARRSLAGMVGVGMGTYIATVEAMRAAGSDQELHLDPSSADFMTIDIGNDRLGLGGIWTSLAKLTSKTAETAWDEDARETWLGDDVLKRNPLIRWVRGRAAPFAGANWDIAMREDFLGRELETPLDWTKHLATQTTPIWLEAGALSTPYRTGPPGLAGELFGARVREFKSSERRVDLRDALAHQVYGKKWTDLNGLQRDKINDSPQELGITLSDTEALQQLDDMVLSERSEAGEIEDITVEKFRDRHKDIDLEWNENVAAGIDFLDAGAIDLKQFRNIYLSSSNAIRRAKMEELTDPDGDFGLAIKHFADNAKRFGEDNPEDVAYTEYITKIIGTDKFDDPEGFDFRRQQEEITVFQQKWGDEVFAYVQGRFAEGRAIPVIVNEFWQGRKRYEYYWRDVEEAVIASVPLSGVVEAGYQQWLESTSNEKVILEKTVPGLKGLLKKMSDVRASLREKDQLLDAWLFRWGYTDTFRHPQNKVSPDGADDAREYWRDPMPLPLETFGIQHGVAL